VEFPVVRIKSKASLINHDPLNRRAYKRGGGVVDAISLIRFFLNFSNSTTILSAPAVFSSCTLIPEIHFDNRFLWLPLHHNHKIIALSFERRER